MVTREKIDVIPGAYSVSGNDDKGWYYDRLGRMPKVGDVFIYQSPSASNPEVLVNRLGLISYMRDGKLYMNRLKSPTYVGSGEKVHGTYRETGLKICGDMMDLDFIRGTYGIIIIESLGECYGTVLSSIR